MTCLSACRCVLIYVPPYRCLSWLSDLFPSSYKLKLQIRRPDFCSPELHFSGNLILKDPY
jgi:hypothetical protein